MGAKVVPPIVEARIPTADPLRVDTPPRPDGAGVVLVINPASGSGTGARVIDEVREALPRAEIVEVGEGDDIAEALRSAAERAEVLAVGGGDGTVSAAAGIALDAKLPLAVFPGGTFNHFAKDIGCETVEQDRRRPSATGSVSCVDVLRLNETETVINTASIGDYPAFVRTREKLEHKVGKPLAGVYAMFHTLRRKRPIRISYDNKTLQTSLFFLGNSVYLPAGFAPSRRTRMDDGLMDVRILETGRRFSTVRILTSLALGRLVRSPLYHELRVPEFSFTAVDGPTPLAHDGEVELNLERGDFQRAVPGTAGVPSVALTGSRHRSTGRHADEVEVAERPARQHVGGMVDVERDPSRAHQEDDEDARDDRPRPAGCARISGDRTTASASTATIDPERMPGRKRRPKGVDHRRRGPRPVGQSLGDLGERPRTARR